MQFTLVAAGPNHIRYAAVNNSTAQPNGGNIQLSGAGDADVAMEDAVVFGPLKDIISTIVTNQTEARLLVMDDGLGQSNNKRAVTTVCARTGRGTWTVDADDDGNDGVAIVVSNDGSGGDSAYVEILYRHSLTQS